VRSLALFLSVLAMAAPATAMAAKRRAPHGFFGTVWDLAAARTHGSLNAHEWGVMARSGVESVRASFNWNMAQPDVGGPISYARTDAVVGRAARHGLTVLPVVEFAPAWARAYPERAASPPASPGPYTDYLVALIRRYGPHGHFWRTHRRIPAHPIHEWQVWNEPELPRGWDVPPDSPYAWPRGYVNLLAPAYRRIKATDRHARVVMAGLANDSWFRLGQLYRAGGRRFFDVAAFHLYTSSATSVLRAARRVRTTMRNHGDRRKPLYATEIGCPAARGRVSGNIRFVSTTDRGMARCVRLVYGRLLRGKGRARRFRRLRLFRVYWYTWGTAYHGDELFSYAGLRRLVHNRRFLTRPALRAYQRSARLYEGCAKTSTGHCRRRHHRRRHR
jgi:hypothetical protein